jgi:uroporphyrinogen decarboxylase
MTATAPTGHLLVRAARGEAVERPPVWAMRQAGRWDPEFNRLRAGQRFYEFSEDVELSAEASLCPRRFGVDAIILFYDITTLTVAMGQPFTLATYCIGTGKDIAATRRFAAEEPRTWAALLDRIGTATAHFLAALTGAGADVYQLFDSWAGLLDTSEYGRWAQPYHRSVFAAVRDAPGILFVKECPYLDEMTRTGAAVISLGTRHDLAEVRRRYPELVFQGNVSDELMRTGTPEQVAAATRACVRAGGGRRHIVNLSHGMDRDTPVANFEAYVRAAKESGS